MHNYVYGYNIPALVREILVVKGWDFATACAIAEELSARLDEKACRWVETLTGKTFNARSR